MIRLLQYLIFGHSHKWCILKQSLVHDEEKDPRPFYLYYLRCDRCGNMKKFY